MGALLASACGNEGAAVADVPTTSLAPTTTAAPTTTTSTTTTAPEPTAPPAAAVEVAPPDVFTAVVASVTEAELGPSWRPGCPVPVEDLRRIDMPHWNDAGDVVTGALVVHADHVDDVILVFDRLFEAAFPIHAMAPVTDFDADDDASMAANNTSAFNCREISGRPGVWSQHSYGGAIDINPLVNPWVRGSQVDPPAGADFVNRDQEVTGLVRAGDVVTEAFSEIGWGWGGDWSSTKDYQHFSHNGR